MFLDGALRALEAAKQELVLRDALLRRLAQLEAAAARSAARRPLREAATGLALAERLLAWLRRP